MKYHLAWVLTCISFSACSKVEVNYEYAQNIVNFVKGDLTPSELNFPPEVIVSKSSEYAEAVSGHVGLPENFDLNLLMGKLLYQWGNFSESLIYLDAARTSKDIDVSISSTDFFLFSSALSNRVDDIEELKGRAINSMLSKEVWIGLASGDCDSLRQAVIDISVASKGNLINRSMQYMEFLSRWVSIYCDSNMSSFYEEQILNPAIQAVTAGKEWATFVQEMELENLRPVQQVLCSDLYSIINSAIRFSSKIDNPNMSKKWTERRYDLEKNLILDRGLKFRVTNRER